MTLLDGLNVILRAFPDRYPIPLPASAVVIVALTLAINSWVAFDKSKDYITETAFFKGKGKVCGLKNFDYVIVGGGGAGMIVATRLANASSHSSILLLEAGGEPALLNDLPSMDFFLLNQAANTWIYNTTVQQYSCGHCDDRKSLTTRGRMLGGSTSTNFMMYVRGNIEDYNRWQHEDAGGDPQWSYKALLPYWRKQEDYHGVHANAPDAHIFHGKGGLLNVGTHDYMPGTNEWLEAAREKGYRIGDYNGADQEVFSPIDVTTQDGWRESTYRAYYKDTGKPRNLCIRKYARVTKVNFDYSYHGKPRATGVTYIKHKKIYHVTATKEVILSAGTIETPKLLLLSGVGPKYDLEAFNIPVVKDLPVGQILQDHTYTIVGPFLLSPSLNPNRDVTLRAAANFLLNGNGAIAAPAGLAGLAFFQSPYAQPPYPDLEVVQFSVAMYPELPRDLNRFFGISTNVLYDWFYPYNIQNTDARFLVLWLGRPKSVGSLRLASRNPFDNPIMDPKYLEHPDDIEALLYGFKKLIDLYENTRAFNSQLFPKPVPGCKNHKFKSDEYYRCVIRHFSGSLYHHVGTCALGKVVDNNLRVKGIEGLRVIDASVIPRTPNANTQAGTFAVAEKGVDLILYGDDHKGGWGWNQEYENEVDPPSYYGPERNPYYPEGPYDKSPPYTSEEAPPKSEAPPTPVPKSPEPIKEEIPPPPPPSNQQVSSHEVDYHDYYAYERDPKNYYGPGMASSATDSNTTAKYKPYLYSQENHRMYSDKPGRLLPFKPMPLDYPGAYYSNEAQERSEYFRELDYNNEGYTQNSNELDQQIRAGMNSDNAN